MKACLNCYAQLEPTDWHWCADCWRQFIKGAACALGAAAMTAALGAWKLL